MNRLMRNDDALGKTDSKEPGDATEPPALQRHQGLLSGSTIHLHFKYARFSIKCLLTMIAFVLDLLRQLFAILPCCGRFTASYQDGRQFASGRGCGGRGP